MLSTMEKGAVTRGCELEQQEGRAQNTQQKCLHLFEVHYDTPAWQLDLRVPPQYISNNCLSDMI
jgi:hypothetical protein